MEDGVPAINLQSFKRTKLTYPTNQHLLNTMEQVWKDVDKIFYYRRMRREIQIINDFLDHTAITISQTIRSHGAHCNGIDVYETPHYGPVICVYLKTHLPYNLTESMLRDIIKKEHFECDVRIIFRVDPKRKSERIPDVGGDESGGVGCDCGVVESFELDEENWANDDSKTKQD
ncbi:hypothetical protein TWF694_009572 [Orbilia ellipsospora]|uniref:Uncharacterized protein n=1 Tax=Orbilia ellipsospora TaxID=2528407 RepID=A0AAV9XBK0_9PEZI